MVEFYALGNSMQEFFDALFDPNVARRRLLPLHQLEVLV
jgi:hypothetical protein